MVRPKGSHPVALKDAECIELLQFEVFWSCIAEMYYPRKAFQVPGRVDPALVKSSLEDALVLHPALAGRVFLQPAAKFTGHLALTNDGVRFTTAVRAGTAPQVLEEAAVPSFCELPLRRDVMAGRAPVLNIKLTLFSGDGKMIIGMSVSHAVYDGTSWSPFLRDWGRAARGEALLDQKPVPLDRSGWKRPRLSLEQAPGRGEKLGFAFHRLMLMSYILGRRVHSGRYPYPVRERLHFSGSELARLKRAATPTAPSGADGCNADGWVTTQEALVAHLLKSLCRALLPSAATEAEARVTFVLDARKAAGMPADCECGCGTLEHAIDVGGLLRKSLPQVAADLHTGLKEHRTAEAYAHRYAERQAWFDEDGDCSELLRSRIERLQGAKKKYPITLKINNQSKVTQLDFGTGGAQMLFPAGGTTLLVAAPPDGILVFLEAALFRGVEPRKRQEALQYLAEIPTV